MVLHGEFVKLNSKVKNPLGVKNERLKNNLHIISLENIFFFTRTSIVENSTIRIIPDNSNLRDTLTVVKLN